MKMSKSWFFQEKKNILKLIWKQRRLEQPPTPAEDTDGEEEPVVIITFTIIIIITLSLSSSLSSPYPLHHHHYQSSHPPPPHQAGPRLILDDFTDSLYASKSTIAFGVSSLSFFDQFVNTQHDVKHCQRHKGPMGWVSPLFLWKCLFFCKLFNG